MRKQEGPATPSVLVSPQQSGYVSGPSHPAFDRLENMRTKQLEEVSPPALDLRGKISD